MTHSFEMWQQLSDALDAEDRRREKQDACPACHLHMDRCACRLARVIPFPDKKGRDRLAPDAA